MSTRCHLKSHFLGTTVKMRWHPQIQPHISVAIQRIFVVSDTYQLYFRSGLKTIRGVTLPPPPRLLSPKILRCEEPTRPSFYLDATKKRVKKTFFALNVSLCPHKKACNSGVITTWSEPIFGHRPLQLTVIFTRHWYFCAHLRVYYTHSLSNLLQMNSDYDLSCIFTNISSI